jgi:ankyrin repeat protein
VTIHALLSHGADPNATVGDLALTPLIGGIFFDSADGIRALHRTCAELRMRLDLERGLESLGVSPLAMAAYLSNPETIQALVEIGCNRGHVNDSGQSVFRSACENPRMDLETLELLWNKGDNADVNECLQPRTMVWRALTTTSELVVKCGGAIPVFGGLAKTFAELRGSTPLHSAAKIGRLDLVEWLVHKGAMRSLHMKTASGASPVVFAERGGYYAVVGFLNDALTPSGREVLDGEYDA